MIKTASPILRRALTILTGGGLALVGAVVLAATPSPARAAQTQGFQISPPVTELALDPGTSTRGTMKVTNLTDTQMTLTLGKQNFVAKGEEGEVELVDLGDPLYSLAPWFTLARPTVEVPPKATKEIEYILSVPADAEPGGRYGSIIFDTIPPKLPTGQSGAAVKQRLAGLIFLRIGGEANEQLAIDSFKTSKTFYEYGPVLFQTRIKNSGNVHEKPTGQIVVKNMFGFTTATIKVDEKNVIPGAVRRLDTQLKRHLLLGRYTASLTLRNGAKQTLTADTTFTVVPYKLLAGLVIAALIFLLFFWKARKRLRRALRILAGRE